MPGPVDGGTPGRRPPAGTAQEARRGRNVWPITWNSAMHGPDESEAAPHAPLRRPRGRPLRSAQPSLWRVLALRQPGAPGRRPARGPGPRRGRRGRRPGLAAPRTARPAHPQPVARGGPRRLVGGARRAHLLGHRPRAPRDPGAALPPAVRGGPAPALRGRGLRRLLRLGEPRPQRRQGLPPGRPRLPHPQLEAPADRLPRPRRHRGGLGHGRRTALRAAQGPRRPGARVRAVDPAGHRGRGRLRRGRADRVGGPGRARRLPGARLRAVPAQRLVRAGHPGLGVRAPRPVPRQVVRDLGVGVDHPAGGPGAREDGPARAHPPAAPLPGRRRPGHRARRLRPADLGRRQRPRGVRAAVLHHVLDRRAAARPDDGQRRLAAHRRPVRLGHRQRARRAPARLAAGADLERP
ncbi:Fumarylacetoacetase [Streptomyces misionensis JCM 4497]